MIVLGIESSCDETAAALVKNGHRILSSVISSQVKLHRPYSGVVPELASRAHVENINDVISVALSQAKMSSLRKVDAIAVTVGPGLVGSLLVGKMTAETLGWVYKKPVIGVNHIEGHLLAAFLVYPKLKPPFLALVVSGGHTELIFCSEWNRYTVLGATRDDAAGEAFDKVAKMLKLGYPGGPIIDEYAKKGIGDRRPFPRAWLPGSWDFSFSGLKTAVLYTLQDKKVWTKQEVRDLCAGFQEAVVEVLVGKTVAAARALRVKTVVVGGGVSANTLLRFEFEKTARKMGINLRLVPPVLCTDNAAMIACSGYFKLRNGKKNRQHLRIQSHIAFSRFPHKLPPFNPFSQN